MTAAEVGTLVTVTESIEGQKQVRKLVCKWCGNDFEREGTRGPDPEYCSASHRQRAYEARRAAIPADGTPEHDVWVAAIDLAAAPPERMIGRTTLVPSADVAFLRDRLEECGVDWRQIKKARRINKARQPS